VGGVAMSTCKAGTDAEFLGRGYRGVPVIHGLRSVPKSAADAS